jgi:AAA domain-containing protein/PEGA domain-containing protein
MSELACQSDHPFYVIGGTLRRDAASYIERDADRQLFIALENHEICYVLTPRQMGKSSLMVRTAARLREAKVAVAVLDLTAFGQNLTREQWYYGLIDRVGRQLHCEDEVEDAWLEGKYVSPLQRWIHTLRDVVLVHCRGAVVVFIDEIDTIRSLPFSTDEFFAGIRELYNRRSEETDLDRLTFCLLGVATPSDLIRDTRTTPFNVGRRIELTDFSEDEAAPLSQGLRGENSHRQKLLKRILHWTGGHPYLTQRLCHAVAEAKDSHSLRIVDQICRDLFLAYRARERDDNLLFVRERMLRSEVETAGLLTLYGRIRTNKRVNDDETNPLITVLRLSGITRVDQGVLKVRNRVYYHVFDDAWVTSNLPDAELRRQRVAYWQGMKRAAAIAVPVLALVVGIGWEKLYRAETMPDVPFPPPEPPAFWLSGVLRSSQQAGVGALLVNAGDRNVTIFVNDQQYGLTTKIGQMRVPGLLPGFYRIRVEKPGYQALTQQAKIIKDSETQITFKLQPAVIVGKLLIQGAPPGTSVRVDELYVGSAGDDGTFSMNVSPGEHTIELAKEGFLTARTKEQLKLGTPLLVSGSLRQDEELRDWAALTNSKDLQAFQEFLRQHPRSRFAEKARGKAEQLEWQMIKDRDDLQTLDALDAFLKRYPVGQFRDAARIKVQQIQAEQMDWRMAATSNDHVALQQFLNKYPASPYAQEARAALKEAIRRKGEEAILNVLKQYEQAYNNQDIDALSAMWPSWPESKKKATQIKFREAQAVSLTLQVDRHQLVIDESGETASVKGRELLRWTKKDQSTSDDEYPFLIQLAYEGGRWIIVKGF